MMRKRSLVSILSLFSFWACTTSNSNEIKEEEVVAEPQSTELKIAGIYKGVLPCADCPGIETLLEIKENGDYHKMQTYLKGDETGSNSFDDFGRWRFSKDSTYIELNYDANDIGIFEYWQIINDSEIRIMNENAQPVDSGSYSLKKEK